MMATVTVEVVMIVMMGCDDSFSHGKIAAMMKIMCENSRVLT